MTMKKPGKYDANGTPSGVTPRMTPNGPMTSEKKSVKGEGSKMSGRMARSFDRKEADEKGRSHESGCME